MAKAGAEIVRRGGNWHRIPVNFGDTSAFVQRDPTYGFSQDAPRDGDMARFSVDGPIHQGYWFDPCRTLVVGAKPSADQRALMEEVLFGRPALSWIPSNRVRRFSTSRNRPKPVSRR